MTSGLVLLKLTRAREFGLERRLMHLHRKLTAPAPQGDMLSTPFSGNPDAWQSFSCRWYCYEDRCDRS
ncbi:hypothetical protein MTO96_046748, partial [Rhipicephalus appendiculatus]